MGLFNKLFPSYSEKQISKIMPMVNAISKHFRPLSDLNLIDNFLFHEMIADKESGEEFCRILLRTFLNKEIRHVKITPQKGLYGLDTDMHGIRMDAYLEENGL